MAIFPHFLAFSVTLLVVRTTVMLTLGTERTQTLVTHMGWWYGVIFAHPMHLSGVRGVHNMAIFWSKSGLYGGLVPGWESNLESVSWAISHLNAWNNMNKDHLSLLQLPIWGSGGLKMPIFGLKNSHWEKIAQTPPSSPR